MARGTRIALAAAAALLVVSGYCLYRPAVAPGPGGTGRTAAPGFSLTGSIRSDPVNYLRAADRGTAAAQALSILIDGRLVRIDRRTDTVEPALAESWTAGDDGRTWTLRLREGVRFSDGTPFTSADVEFSARALYDPKLASTLAQLFTLDGQPLTFSAPDPRTVVVTFPAPFAPGVRLLESLPIVPKHKLEAALADGTLATVWASGTAPSALAGLGPFVLTEHTPGARMVFARNPHYWRTAEDGTRLPYLDGLTLQVIRDQNTEAVRLIAGDIDFLTTSDPRAEDLPSLRRAEEAGQLRIIDAGPTLDPDFLWFSTVPLPHTAGRPWLHERDFRHAIALSVDRQGLADGPYLGTAIPIHGPVTPANTRWYSPSAPRFTLDRARARQLLAGIGLTDRDNDGLVEDASGADARFSILVQSGHVRERAATYIQEQLRQAGLTVDVVALDTQSMIGRYGKKEYDAIYHYLPSGATDPALLTEFWLSSGGFHVWNPNQKTPATAWEARIDELMRKNAAAADDAERKALFAEAQRIMGEELPALYFVASQVLVPVSSRVGNARPVKQSPQLLWDADTLSAVR
jgi:peptide/nickel transport system substrate-binding protein